MKLLVLLPQRRDASIATIFLLQPARPITFANSAVGIISPFLKIEGTRSTLAEVQPAKAYLSVPTRPPAERWALSPSEERINQAYQIFREKLEQVELLVGYEGDLFTYTGDVEHDLLGISSVHPMRESAVKNFLEQAQKSWEVVRRLIDQGLLVETEYEGIKFYLRRPTISEATDSKPPNQNLRVSGNDDTAK